MKMSSYHKPRVFRSVEGCCICKAKSSSSRFTDSGKYESAFSACFKVAESARSGDICNACVLIVKRWRNLPRHTDKDWSHVVNSREGPGGSKVTFRNVKKTVVKVEMVEEKFEKIRKKKQKAVAVRKAPEVDTVENDIPGFIDLTYFKRNIVCCGVVYEGLAGEVIIDQRFFKRCPLHSGSSSSTSSVVPSPLSPAEEDSLQVHKADELFEDSDENVDDTDSISFYSDDMEIVSKLSKDDLGSNLDTDGDEGFFDKSEIKTH